MSTTKRRRRINRDHIVPIEPAAEQVAPLVENKPPTESSDKTEEATTTMTSPAQKVDGERSPLSAHRRLMRFEFPSDNRSSDTPKQQKQRVRRVSRRSAAAAAATDGDHVPPSSVASSPSNETEDTASQEDEMKESPPPSTVVQHPKSRSQERSKTGDEREMVEEEKEEEAVGVKNAHEEVKREYYALFGSDDDDSDDAQEEQRDRITTAIATTATTTEETDTEESDTVPSTEKKRRQRRQQQQQGAKGSDSPEVRTRLKSSSARERKADAQSKMTLLDSEREKAFASRGGGGGGDTRKKRERIEDEQIPRSNPPQSPAETPTEIPAIRIPKKPKTLEAKKEADTRHQKKDRKDTGGDRRYQEADRRTHAASFPEVSDDRERRESHHHQHQIVQSPRSKADGGYWPLRDESDRARDRWDQNVEAPRHQPQEDRYYRSSEHEVRAANRDWRRGERNVHRDGHDDVPNRSRTIREWPPRSRSLGEQPHADPMNHEERRDRRDFREIRPFDDNERRYREREQLDMAVSHDKRRHDAPQDWRDSRDSRSPRRSDMHREHDDGWKRYGQHHREWNSAFDIVGERERPRFEERPFNDAGPYHHREHEREVYWGDPLSDRTSHHHRRHHHHHAHREKFSPPYSPQEDHRRGLLGTPPSEKERDTPDDIRKSGSKDTRRSRYPDARGDRTRSPSLRHDDERWQKRREFESRRKQQFSPPATHRSKSRSRTRSRTRSPDLHKRSRRSSSSRRSQGDRRVSSEMMDTNDDWHDADSSHSESRAAVEEEEKAPYSEPVDMSRIEMLHPTLHKLHELSFAANRKYKHFGMGTGFLPNFSDDVASLRVLEKDVMEDTKFNLPMPSVPQNATPSNTGTISPQHRPPIINISHLYKEKYGNISNPSSSTPPPMNMPLSTGDTDDRKAVKRQVGELVKQRLQKYYSQRRISSKEEFKVSC